MSYEDSLTESEYLNQVTPINKRKFFKFGQYHEEYESYHEEYEYDPYHDSKSHKKTDDNPNEIQFSLGKKLMKIVNKFSFKHSSDENSLTVGNKKNSNNSMKRFSSPLRKRFRRNSNSLSSESKINQGMEKSINKGLCDNYVDKTNKIQYKDFMEKNMLNYLSYCEEGNKNGVILLKGIVKYQDNEQIILQNVSQIYQDLFYFNTKEKDFCSLLNMSVYSEGMCGIFVKMINELNVEIVGEELYIFTSQFYCEEYLQDIFSIGTRDLYADMVSEKERRNFDYISQKPSKKNMFVW